MNPAQDQRNLKVDVCALGLLALTLFLLVSLGSYSRTDPPSQLVFPPPSEIQNACGAAGAFASHYLLESCGVGAYYFVTSLAVTTFFLLIRRQIQQPYLRVAGWLLTLIAITTLASLAIPNLSPGPVIGSGGYLGAMGRCILEDHFATAGAYIFATAFLVAGLLLCTDYFFFNAAAATTRTSTRGLITIGQAVSRRGPAMPHYARLAPRSENEQDRYEEGDESEDEYEDEEEYEEDDLPSLDEADEYEEEEEEEDFDDLPPISTPGSKKKSPPSAPARSPRVDRSHPQRKPSPAKKKPTAAATVATGGAMLAGGIKNALGLGATTSPPVENAKPTEPTSAPTEPNFEVVTPKKKNERDEIIEKLEAADSEMPDLGAYELPSLDLLLPSDDVCYEEHEKEVRRKAKVLEKTFKSFGLNIRVAEIETGPVIAQYEIELEPGLRLSKITGLADDLAIALRVPSVRIVAPIPGKNTVGIEVPNENRQIVRLREVIEETNGRVAKMKIPIFLGKDVAGNPLVVDLASLPHLLIAGRTGTGKSVCLNSIIASMLMSRGPDEVRMLMIDPKMVELSGYRKLPHLMHPVVTDMRKAEAILAWAVDKMEERYQLLARAGVRHISSYNQLGDEELRDRITPRSDAEWEDVPKQLPFIVIVADEMADLMMTAGKDVEQHIIRLAQKSRAVGIHLILATQKPTVDVITGLIKSNLPARIAFQVASRTDSRVVLDEMGADKLLGNGDMLFLSPGTSMLLRGQGTFLSDDEITRVVDFVGTENPQFAHELLELKTKDEQEQVPQNALKSRDELYEAAIEIIVREQRGSCSLLQRALGIGYGRAARLIDFMAEDGIVGQYNGAQAREVLLSMEDWQSRSQATEDDDSQAAPTVLPATSTDSSDAKEANLASEPDIGQADVAFEDEEFESDENDDEYEEEEALADAAFDDDPSADEEEWEDEEEDEEEYEEDEEEEEDEEVEDDELADGDEEAESDTDDIAAGEEEDEEYEYEYEEEEEEDEEA